MTKRRIFAFIIWFISVQGCHMKNILIIPPKNQVSIHLEESLPAEILIKNKDKLVDINNLQKDKYVIVKVQCHQYLN